MKLLVIKGAQKGKIIPLADTVISIGREVDNSFVINEAGVSRHHCQLSPIGREWFVEDCKSVNGVLLNGEKISQGSPLRVGDVFTVFSHEFKVLNDSDREEDFLLAEPNQNRDEVQRSVAPVVAPAAAGRGIFWGKILLLAVIAGLVVYLALQVFSSGSSDSDPPVSVETVAPAEVAAALPSAAEPAPRGESAGMFSPSEPVQQEQPVARVAESSFSTASSETSDSASPKTSQNGGAAAASEVVLALSDPPGATVILDGKRQEGLTPLVLRNLSLGRHSLELHLEGYEISRRTIHVPDIQATRPVVLRPRAGTLLLTSTPPGAHIWLERQLLGVTPVLLSSLPPGTHDLILRGPGCEAKKISVTISDARSESQSVELPANLGNLELRTQPPGCKIFLQGALLGQTIPEGDQLESAPLLLNNIMVGDQRFKIEHRSGASFSGRITIARNETTTKLIKLPLPTHRLITVDNQIVDGVLLETTPQGDVVIEDLFKKSERYLRPKIKELRRLSDAEIISAVESARQAGKRGENLSAGRGDEVLTIADLERAMSIPAEDFNKANAGKTYTIYGKSTMVLNTGKGITTVVFSPKIRCQFQDLSKEEIDFFTAPEQPSVTFQGTCFGIGKDAILLFKNCRFLSEF